MGIIDTLITDRTQSDVTRWRTLHDRGWAGMTADERAEWSAGMKGAYNATDLNRVNDALIYLRDLFGGFGFSADIELPVITDVTPGTIEPGESRLPDGYTELEYIESSGAQYINTGFQHNQNTRIVMDVQSTNITANSWAFEGRIATNSARHGVFFYYSSGNLWNMDYSGNTRISFSGISSTDRLLIDYNKNVCSINGVTNTATTGTFQSTANLTLLAANTAGKVAGHLRAKLYSCQIYDNGALIRNYVPAKNSSEVVGLYDLVNDTFYQNAGEGIFTDGPEIVPEPIITPPVITTRTNWTIKDIPTAEQVEQYLANVEAIRSMMSNIPVYPSDWQAPPETPETMQHLTYEQANDIERILTDINDLLVWVSNNLLWLFAGDVYAGEW